jgi:hypothetical protein
MKKAKTILGAVLFTSLILTSCGDKKSNDDKKNEEHNSDLTSLQGKYFTRLDKDIEIYFINDSELLWSVDSRSGDNVWSYKYKYSLKGNELIIHNKNKADTTSQDSKYIIYNNEVLMCFWDGEFDYPRGVSYKLSK